MNIQNSNLIVISCFTLLITACSNQASIKSVTPDKVVIEAQSGDFVNAYHMAQKECQKNTKTARYSTDESTDLEVLTFDCIGLEPEEEVAEAVIEEDTTEAEAEAEEPATEEEALIEEITEIETVAEEPATEALEEEVATEEEALIEEITEIETEAAAEETIPEMETEEVSSE